MGTGLDRLFAVLLPERCVACGRFLKRSGPLGAPACGPCLSMIRRNTGPRCRVCDLPLVSEREICLDCRGAPRSYLHNRSIWVYEGVSRDLILAYKVSNQRRLAKYFASVMDEVLGEEVPDCAIVPVPGRPESVLRRGWDQTLEIARKLRGGRTVAAVLLRSNSRSQKDLSKDERLVNLRASIRVGPGKIPRSLVILDDVFTTGATVEECARVLRAAGAQEIYALTLARD